MRTGCDFKKGFVGGESGFSAASLRLCCDAASSDGVETDADDAEDGDEGERTKVRKPNASSAARMRVMGPERRRVTAMMLSIRIVYIEQSS